MARSRGVLTIVQYEKHPVTGEELINEEVIIGGLRGLKGVKKSCYIYHNEDTYKQSDVENTRKRLEKEYIEKQKEFVNEEGMVTISMDDYVEREMATTYSYIVVGALKPPHYHIVILPKSDLDLESVAAVFGVPVHLVEANKNRKDGRTWYECVKYLTHTTTNAIKEGKYKYSSEEVTCFGFSYEEEMAEYERMLDAYGKALTPEEEIFLQVSHGEKTPKDVKEENELFYLKNMDRLKKIHNDYLDSISLPPFRLNIYVEGAGGEGKGTMVKYIAKSLSGKNTFFTVGGKNVTFEGYRGEDVIVWDDMRAEDILEALGGEGKVMSALDPFPDEDDRKRQHVKFDVVNLVNRVNIFNSVQPYEEFLRALVSGTTNAGKLNQSYRRFPMIIRLHPEDFDILINLGFLNDTREYRQYEAYTHLRGNFARIANVCKNNLQLKNEIIGQTVEPVLDQIQMLEERMGIQEADDEAIREMFKTYGTFDLDAISNDHKSIEEKEKEALLQAEREAQEQAEKEREEGKFRAWLCKLSPEEVEQVRREHEEELAELFSFDD